MAKKSETKRIKKEKYHTDEQLEAIRFVKILLVLVILIVGIYFLTRAFVTKDLFNKKETDNTVQGEINYNTTLIGSMFSKPEEEYYVMIYDTENINAVYYSGLASNYSRKEKALKVYFADLNNGLNKKYVAKENENVNVNTIDFDEFKVGELALIKVSKGKIVKALTEEEEIAKELEPTEVSTEN